MIKNRTTALTAKYVTVNQASSFEPSGRLMFSPASAPAACESESLCRIRRAKATIVTIKSNPVQIIQTKRHIGFFFLKQTTTVCKETFSMFARKILHLSQLSLKTILPSLAKFDGCSCEVKPLLIILLTSILLSHDSIEY
jgi:hypothetical protein